MRKPTFQTKRQRKRKAIRSLYGNPWDSSSSSSSRRTPSSNRRSATKKRVTFRQPIERSASKSKSKSKTSSPSNVWRTVSSEKK
jgi:hypothetical protein